MPKPKAVRCDHDTERGKCRVCSPVMWARNRYRTHLKNAKRRQIANELTQERYVCLINRDCLYCHRPQAGGVDRVNSKIHYTVENSAPCCHRCNSMKGALPVEEFLAHMNRIATHNSRGTDGTSEDYRMAHAPEPRVDAVVTQ